MSRESWVRWWTIAWLSQLACGGHGGSDGGDTGNEDDAADDVILDAPEGGSFDGGLCDADGDGAPSVDCGGSDCNDDDPTFGPGAADNLEFAWQAQLVDPDGTIGSGALTSIAVDAAGVAHIAYGHYDGVRYANDASGSWLVETIDPTGGLQAAIAVGPQGELHVAYPSAMGIQHATTASGTWEVQSVDAAAGELLDDIDIAVDADGHAHVVYTQGGIPSAVRYATDESGSFVTQTIADGDADDFTGRAFGVAIAVAPGGTVHAAYTDASGPVSHAVRQDVGWAAESVQGGAGTYLGEVGDLAIDGDGEPHLSFVVGSEVWYGAHAVDEWDAVQIGSFEGGSGGGYNASQPALAVEADGKAHIAFESAGYATDETGTWRVEAEAAVGGSGVSMAIDAERTIHVSWAGGAYARRVQPDGIDQNCDGVDGVDADGDGHASTMTGGQDCDDASPTTYPGAEDPPGDALDQNCDGLGGS